MSAILLHLIPASIYVFLGLAWRRLSTATSSLAGWLWHGLPVLALALHASALYQDMFALAGGLRFGLASALSLTLWLVIAVYFFESRYARINKLLALAMPVAAVCCVLPLMLPGPQHPGALDTWTFRGHFIVAMLAYSLFTLAALHALMMGVAERQLHRARLNPNMDGLPPLLTLENLLFRLIGIAFVFLTLTVLSGVVFSEQVFGKPFTFSHKTVFTVLSWLVFGGLLLGRRLRGWRGRIAQRWTLAGFICLLLAYVGTRFVLEIILARH